MAAVSVSVCSSTGSPGSDLRLDGFLLRDLEVEVVGVLVRVRILGVDLPLRAPLGLDGLAFALFLFPLLLRY